MVLGGGPNRIGQGIEFDYCCVHAALAMREDGYETIMVNCNPETVSTDYDTSDRLYFEPLTLEDVLEIVDKEKPFGVIVQYGGQTPLKLARDLEASGRADHRHQRRTRSTSAEDRERFQQAAGHSWACANRPTRLRAPNLKRLRKLLSSVTHWWFARATCWVAAQWKSCTSSRDLERYMREAVKVSHESPVLLDRFLNDAIECRCRLRSADHCGRSVHRWCHGAHRTGWRAQRVTRPVRCRRITLSKAEVVDELKRQTAADG
jgi:carbamoyl-phosphate synthase large subunit